MKTLKYIPKYVNQTSDLNFGEKVTHENYNEKLNLNTTQGDYNTHVLDILLNGTDEIYRIAYLDKMIEDQNKTIEEAKSASENAVKKVDDLQDHVQDIDTDIANILNGTSIVEHSRTADAIKAGLTAGANKYYGTDLESNLGFITLPELMYAEDIGGTVETEGIYFLPLADSVTEDMLAPAVRTKLNEEGVTEYRYLQGLPKINGVTLEDDVSLATLGIQPVGDFVTNSSLSTQLNNYYVKSAVDSAISNAVSDKATESTTNALSRRIDALDTSLTGVRNTANAAAVVQVNSWSGTAKNGDLLVYV